MSKVVADKHVCDACSADIRAESLFCYNCGAGLSPKRKALHQTHTRSTQRTGLSDNRTETLNRQGNSTAAGRFAADEELTTGTSHVPRLKAAVERAKVEETNEATLRSTRAVRNPAKTIERKPVEVVWVERESSPARLLVISIAVTLLAALLLFLAFYSR